MNRLIRWMALFLAIGSLTVGSAALAGVPKVVFGENFGATW